jgi:hypothetical protein
MLEKKMILDEQDSLDKYVKAKYLNKPHFIQLKRVWRMVKKIPNQAKVKKLGFYLQEAKRLQGSAQINEEIIRNIFGNKQEMSPQEFIEKIFEYETPEGSEMFIKKETAYQTTQRLMPNEKLNKTISVSIFGEIYDGILKNIEKKIGENKTDILARQINKYLSSHFNGAAGFIRWTEMSPKWIHIDAFQTDFFNKIKAMSFKNEEFKPVGDEIRKYEDEFFKTAMSYIIRSYPSAKIFTANTEDTVAAIENIKGDVKLKKYYHQLPKKLGFRLINLQDFYNKVLRTRPGERTEKDINKIDSALSRITGKNKVIVTKNELTSLSSKIADEVERKVIEGKKKNIDQSEIDSIISSVTNQENIKRGYHQFIGDISKLVRSHYENPKDKKQKISTKIRSLLKDKSNTIQEIANRYSEIKGQIWWANRGLIFENTKYETRMLREQILYSVRR